MQQLPLDVRLADHAVFESFHATGNELLVHQLRTVATTPGQPPLWLWAPAGQGKTHLLQATVALADEQGGELAMCRSIHRPLCRLACWTAWELSIWSVWITFTR